MAERAQRRLAAIVAADVAGYSRLMGLDEEGTLTSLKSHRQDLVDPRIAEHNGRIVKTTGDGLLVEFASVVDAVGACIAIQRAMAERNAAIAPDARIEFRVGINVGDIIIDGDDIYGDGVNVAARLEGLAVPGGICISRAVRDQIRDRMDVDLEDLGEVAVKNIARPVRVFRVAVGDRQAGSAAGNSKPVAAAIEKPAIAVLPFDNMGGDPEQEYFVDGITEDIITVLSKFRTFSVCARNSTFVFKGTPVDIRRLADELGARYVVEGSVRKGGNRLRVTAQLIDATTGNHVWAERYDRELADIFAVQDDITESIVAAVAPEVVLAEIVRAQHKDVADLGSWDAIMRARWHMMRFTKEDNAETKQLLSYATERDPNSVVAWSDLAWSHMFDFSFGWSEQVPESIAHAAAAAGKAVSLDRNDARAHTALGIVALFSARHDDALNSLRQAIAFNPNEPLAHGYLGLTCAFVGDGRTALVHLEDAMRLSPRDPFMIIWLMGATWSCFVEQDFEMALAWIAKARQENPHFPDVYTLEAALNILLNRPEPARAAAEKLLQLMPGLTRSDERLYRPFKRDEDRERLMSSLAAAGVPG